MGYINRVTELEKNVKIISVAVRDIAVTTNNFFTEFFSEKQNQQNKETKNILGEMEKILKELDEELKQKHRQND